MRKILVSVVFLLTGYLFAGYNFDNPSKINFKNIEVPSVKVKKDNRVKDITLMVFMNAKNNLSESHLFGVVGKWHEKDMDEMKKVGTTDKVNVVVEYGEKGKGSKRVLILKKSGFFSSGEKVYESNKNADMGDYRRVIDFVKWAKKNFPAKRYILVLWNHGLGWIDPNLQQHTAGTGVSKGILFDDDTKNYTRTKEIGKILKESGGADVLIFNACLMQMAEVLYEVKDYTNLVIGSEETMLAWGYDYEDFLKFLNRNPNFTYSQISEYFINWYKKYYGESLSIGPVGIPLESIPLTLSAVRTDYLKDLPKYLNYFVSNTIENEEKQAVVKAMKEAVRFTGLDPKDKEKKIAPYVDLYDFVRIVGENSLNQETKKSADMLMDFIKNNLVIKSIGLHKDTTNNYDYSLVGGISINMTMKIKPVPPQLDSIYETKYGDLSLSKDSMWDEFVKWIDEVWAAN